MFSLLVEQLLWVSVASRKLYSSFGLGNTLHYVYVEDACNQACARFHVCLHTVV